MRNENVLLNIYENNKPTFREKRKGYLSLEDIINYYKEFYDRVSSFLNNNDYPLTDEDKGEITKYLRTFPIVLQNKVIVLPYSYTSLYNGTDEFTFKDIAFIENGRVIAAIDLDQYKVDEFINNEHKARYYADYTELYDDRKKLLLSKVDEEYLPTFIINAVDSKIFKLDGYCDENGIIIKEKLREKVLDAFKKIELEFKVYESKMFALINKEHNYDDLKELAVHKIYKEQEELRIKKQKKDELKRVIFEAIKSLNELVDSSSERLSRFNLPEGVLFKEVNGVKKIDDLLLTGLKYLDLSHVIFDGVDVRGVDFTDCNPTLLNPQTIYNRDLSNTVFIEDSLRVNNVFPFGINTNFNNVNLSGAQIDIKDPILINFDGIFKDDKTSITMNGESLINKHTR